tara:strand:+ start:236 stop:724 length:489 start_codon:yes stop_codon:yes gene_type:complete
MTDIVDKQKRSWMMSRIKNKDTKPELVVRQILYSNGYRYRIHVKSLPGKPDIVFHGRKKIIRINGCFWHGHDCDLFSIPKTNRGKWMHKIGDNVNRDECNFLKLDEMGWKVCTLWECSIRGKERLDEVYLSEMLFNWIDGSDTHLEIRGKSWDGEIVHAQAK